jgi:hypothetical protein
VYLVASMAVREEMDNKLVISIIIIIFVFTFVQGIYKYVPETNNFSVVRIVSGII